MAPMLPAYLTMPVVSNTVTEMKMLSYFCPKLVNIKDGAIVRRMFMHKQWSIKVVPWVDKCYKARFKFGEGWEAFLQENGAMVGDSLMIQYDVNSVFKVAISDFNDVVRKPVDRGVNPYEGINHGRGHRPLYLDDSEYAIAGSTFLSNSPYPHFLAVLTNGYMQINTLGLLLTQNVEISFASRYFATKEDEVVVIKVKGDYFQVTSKSTYRDDRMMRCKIKNGFKEVIEEAYLNEVYVLVFELLAEEPNKLFMVTVFGNYTMNR